MVVGGAVLAADELGPAHRVKTEVERVSRRDGFILHDGGTMCRVLAVEDQQSSAWWLPLKQLGCQ